MLTKQKFVLYEAVAVLRIIQQVEQRASRTQLHNNNLKYNIKNSLTWTICYHILL